MKKCLFLAIILPLCICPLSGCKKKPVEKFSADEVVAAAKLKPAKDPIQEEIYAFRLKTRQAYNRRQFDELETKARELRVAKPLFSNGSWKIAQFYESFECRHDEPESMWQLHDRIHHDWIAAKPDSVTARVAYADFLVEYAWRARGSGFADTVTKTGWRLFRERLASARSVLGEARRLPEKDPVWWLVALFVARGESWTRMEYNALFAEAKAFAPTFLGL